MENGSLYGSFAGGVNKLLFTYPIGGSLIMRRYKKMVDTIDRTPTAVGLVVDTTYRHTIDTIDSKP